MHYAFRTLEFEVGSLDTELLEAGMYHLKANFSCSMDKEGYGLYRIILQEELLPKLNKHIQLATESRRKIKNTYVLEPEIYFHTRKFLVNKGFVFEEEWIDGEAHFYITASIADYQILNQYMDQEYEKITRTE